MFAVIESGPTAQTLVVVSIIVGSITIGTLVARWVKQIVARKLDDGEHERLLRGVPPTVINGLMIDPGVPSLKKRIEMVETRQEQHWDLLTEIRATQMSMDKKLTPNGGDTRNAGDILLRIAEQLGIDLPDKEVKHDS